MIEFESFHDIPPLPEGSVEKEEIAISSISEAILKLVDKNYYGENFILDTKDSGIKMTVTNASMDIRYKNKAKLSFNILKEEDKIIICNFHRKSFVLGGFHNSMDYLDKKTYGIGIRIK